MSEVQQEPASGEDDHTENAWFKFYFASWYRKSPYFQRTVEAGCTSWDLYNHMLIPTYYDDDIAEYQHLLDKVTIWDVAVERQVEITGPDAARFTQLLTPRDLSTCAVGQCKYVTDLRARRRHRERPDPPPAGGGPFLAVARGLRHAAVRARRERLRRSRRPDPGARRVTAAGAGPPLERGDPVPLRRRDRRPPVLLVLGSGSGRDPARGLADGMDGRGRLRAVPARRVPWSRALGPRDGGRSRARDPSDRAQRPTTHGGRDLQLRQRHGHHEQPVRGHGAGAARGARQRP